MILFPAVDLKDGKAVRLRQGKAEENTVFSDDPVSMALRWQEQGASFLHIIDLDGAFTGNPANAAVISKIINAINIPMQLGGGIRNEDTAKRWLDMGVQRLIIGTLALEDPARFKALCHAHPKQIGVSLDAVGNKLKTRGWLKDSAQTLDDIVPSLAEQGAAFLIYTDIERDGTGLGINLPMLTHLASTSPVPVIAAGGMSTLDDVRILAPLAKNASLEGAIIGQALYTGTLNLQEALRWISEQS